MLLNEFVKDLQADAHPDWKATTLKIAKSHAIMTRFRNGVAGVPVFGKSLHRETMSVRERIKEAPDFEGLRASPLYGFMDKVFAQMAMFEPCEDVEISRSILAARAIRRDAESDGIALIVLVCQTQGLQFEKAIVSMVSAGACRFSAAKMSVLMPPPPAPCTATRERHG
tara:strand:- start:2223 stop:2729 length:507 start_codon:yes stop_codon:yes gene_type:complete